MQATEKREEEVGEKVEEVIKRPKTHPRAGITTNKGQGVSPARRKMQKESRKKNRKKGR